MLTDKVNALLLQRCDKKISAQKAANYLVGKGYLEVEIVDNKNSKVATKRGEILGITTTLIKRQTGESYKQNFYNRAAQEFLIDNIEEIIAM